MGGSGSLESFSGLAAGMAGGAFHISFTPDAAAAIGYSITLVPEGSNASGFSGVAAGRDPGPHRTIESYAEPQVNTASPINFGNVRAGTSPNSALSISNAAPVGGESLNVTATASGEASVTGSITELSAAAAPDTTDIVAGLNTSASGPKAVRFL